MKDKIIQLIKDHENSLIKDYDKLFNEIEGIFCPKNEYTDEFEHFWVIYGKNIGKQKAFREWKKLKSSEVSQIFNHVRAYVSSKEKQFRKDPERYLKHKTFNDEVVNANNKRDTGATPDQLAEIVARRFAREQREQGGG